MLINLVLKMKSMGLLSKMYVEWYWKKKYGKFRHFITALELHRKEINEQIFFIQIGTNDRVGYPLEEFISREGWSGILIEPDKVTFERLVHNYSGLGSIKFENVAISSQEEEKEFFYVSDRGNAPEWATELNSLKKQGLEWLKTEYPSVTISSKKLDCKPIGFILNKNRLDPAKVSIIQIDTEGHDHVILQSFDWTRLRPGIVIFEHRHLTQDEHKGACKLLTDNRYNLFFDIHDTLAYSNDIRETLFKRRYEL